MHDFPLWGCLCCVQALVDAIAVKAGVPKKTAALVLGATLDVIVDSVCEGHKVSLVGFGTFASKDRAERMARNPKTGEQFKGVRPLHFAASRRPHAPILSAFHSLPSQWRRLQCHHFLSANLSKTLSRKPEVSTASDRRAIAHILC